MDNRDRTSHADPTPRIATKTVYKTIPEGVQLTWDAHLHKYISADRVHEVSSYEVRRYWRTFFLPAQMELF